MEKIKEDLEVEKIEITSTENPEHIKTATIRGEGVRDCPFCLEIPLACNNVGDAIHRMAPIEQKSAQASIDKTALVDQRLQNEQIAKANRLVYAYHKGCKQCPYASKILEGQKKVDCNFGDTGAGQKAPSFVGSPLYPQTFQGIGLDGLYGYPLGFYSDNNESRNLFFGLFSFLGFASPESLIKLANEYDQCGEKEKADIVDGLLKKMQQLKDEYKETFDKVQTILEEYREKYEADKMDTGLIWNLADKWFGSRQCNR